MSLLLLLQNGGAGASPSGTGAITLAPVAVSGVGIGGAVGTGAATLQPVSISGSGTQTFTATGALTLKAAAVSGTGTETFTATGSLTLQPVAISGTGTLTISAMGDVTLAAVTVSGTGAFDTVPTTFCDYDYADDTYDNAADSYDCSAILAASTGRRRPIVPAPTVRIEPDDDEDLAVVVAFLRHRLRL